MICRLWKNTFYPGLNILRLQKTTLIESPKNKKSKRTQINAINAKY